MLSFVIFISCNDGDDDMPVFIITSDDTQSFNTLFILNCVYVKEFNEHWTQNGLIIHR